MAAASAPSAAGGPPSPGRHPPARRGVDGWSFLAELKRRGHLVDGDEKAGEAAYVWGEPQGWSNRSLKRYGRAFFEDYWRHGQPVPAHKARGRGGGGWMPIHILPVIATSLFTPCVSPLPTYTQSRHPTFASLGTRATGDGPPAGGPTRCVVFLFALTLKRGVDASPSSSVTPLSLSLAQH